MFRKRLKQRLIAVAVTAVLAPLLMTQSANAAPAGPQLDPPNIDASYDVMGDAYDAYGNYVPLRRGYYDGTNGFGIAKASVKHDVSSLDAFRFVLASPEFVKEPAPSTSWRYYAYADKIICDYIECQIVDSRRVKLVADQRLLSDGKPFGLVTLYCIPDGGAEREELCPSWVNTALVNGWNHLGDAPRANRFASSAAISQPTAVSAPHGQVVTYE